jgi:hyperosmotically inducible protein
MKTRHTLGWMSGALVVALTAAVPAAAQTAEQKAREAARETREEMREAKQETKGVAGRSGNAITDSWITMKVHSQFVPEDALEDSDIDVETRAGVVTLMGTVATAAGKSRAVAIAKATDGVKSVNDRLRIAPEDADDDDDRPAAAGAAAGAAAREGARETKAAGRSAGRAMSDGWITSKIYADFIDEAPLEDSDIDVDVEKGVVTLTGTVASKAGMAHAATVAQKIEGVKSVRNNLKVRPER